MGSWGLTASHPDASRLADIKFHGYFIETHSQHISDDFFFLTFLFPTRNQEIDVILSYMSHSMWCEVVHFDLDMTDKAYR